MILNLLFLWTWSYSGWIMYNKLNIMNELLSPDLNRVGSPSSFLGFNFLFLFLFIFDFDEDSLLLINDQPLLSMLIGDQLFGHKLLLLPGLYHNSKIVFIFRFDKDAEDGLLLLFLLGQFFFSFSLFSLRLLLIILLLLPGSPLSLFLWVGERRLQQPGVLLFLLLPQIDHFNPSLFIGLVGYYLAIFIKFKHSPASRTRFGCLGRTVVIINMIQVIFIAVETSA